MLTPLPRTCLSRGVLASSILLLASWGLTAATAAEEKSATAAAEAPPEDTAVLTLSLPEKATITMNGQPVAVQRKYEFQPLKAGTLYTYQLRITMPDGSQRDRTLLLRGGWNVELTIPATVAARPEIMPQTGHALSIWGLAFSHDGRYLLTGAMDMAAVLWDAKTGRQLRVLRGHTSVITSVAFSPDDKQVLTGSFDGSAILWNPRTGEKVRTFSRSATLPVWSVAFTPDGQQVVTDGVFWDVNTGANVRSFMAEGHTIRAFAISRDGRLAASGAHAPGATAIVWDMQTGRALHTLSGHSNNVTSVSLSPDGRMLASGSDDGKVIVWDTQTGQKLHQLAGHTDQVKSVAFHPDGRRLLSGGLDQNVIVWDASTGQRLDAFSPRGIFPGQDKIWAMTYTPDGKSVLASVGHNSAVLWNLQTKKEVLRYEGATTIVGAAAFSADGRRARMIAGLWGLDWDSRTGRPVGNGMSLQAIPKSPMTSVAFDRDARHVLISLQDNTDHLYDIQAGRALQVFRDHAGGLFHVACSPDGRLALTGSKSANAYLWDIPTGRRHELAGHGANPYCAAFGADGRYAVSGGFDGMAIVWDTQTHQQRRAIQTGGGVMAVAISRDNSRVLTGGWDRSVSLWDVASGNRLRTMTGHDGWIWTVAFSPDGRYLASGAWDNKIIVWNAETGEVVRTFLGHSGWITSVQLSPDNRYLLSGSFDGTARLWDMATGDELAAMVGLNFAKDWLVITPDGLFDGSRLGREMVSFRFGGELNVVPVDRFFQDCYRPGLLSDLWKGGRPALETRLGASQPPAVRIVTPGAGGPVEKPELAIKVEVADQGGGVRGPWLMQNGARVQAPSTVQREGNVVRREFEVSLVEGENRIEVRAASADGSWESEPGVVVVEYQQPLPKPKLHLITVGVNQYADKAMQLQFAKDDAAAIAEIFRQRGTSLYRQVDITNLADRQATKANILKTIREVAMQTRAQDTLLAFFAGHGTTIDNQYYFLPSEFHERDGSRAESVKQQGVAAADVGEAMAAASALKRILVFDTCQSGTANQAARTARNPFALRGAIERLSREEGAFTIAAGAISQQAHEVTDLKHGILTYTLLAGLHAAGGGPLEKQWIEPTSEERVAHVLEWFAFASAHVPQLTARYFGQEQDIQYANAGASFAVLPVPQTGQMPGTSTPAIVAAPLPKPERVDSTPQSPPRSPSRSSAAHVVAVGINQYAQAAMNLKFAAPDAKAVGELFQSRGRMLYGDVHVSLVLDGKATRAGILGVLKQVAAAARPDDLAVLFVAGHGVMVGQRYYFIPHDFSAKTHALQEDIRTQGIPADELADAMAEIKALKQILIIDTCASGGVFELGRTLRDPMAFRGVIDRLGRRQGVFTIAAAAAGEEAQEIEQLGHGVLSYTLLAALKAVPSGPLEGKTLHPDNPRGLADVLDWFGFASGHVPRLAERYLGKPQYVQTSGQGKSFLVLPVGEP